MDFVQSDIGCQEVTVKDKRVKKRGSKKFQKLLHILYSGKHSHMIYFTNMEPPEFEVKLTDKKSRQWNRKDISLFLDLDTPKYPEETNSDTETKNRFKSFMTKLVRSDYLKDLGPREESNSVSFKRYRILKECFNVAGVEEGYSLESTNAEFKEDPKDLSSSSESPVTCSYPTSSHYLCLSRECLNSEVYIIPCRHEDFNIPPTLSFYFATEVQNKAGEVDQNLSTIKPYWNNVENNSLLEDIQDIIQTEKNAEEINKNELDLHADRHYESAESINSLVGNQKGREVNENIAGEVNQNISIGIQYLDEPSGNCQEFMDILFENESSINILQVANEEVVEASEILSNENHYANKPNCNNYDYISMLYGNAEVNKSIEVNENIAGEVDETISGVNQFLNKPDCKPDSKRKLNLPDTQSKKYRPEDWSPSKISFDLAMLEDTGELHEILKNSTNPLLSSVAEPEESIEWNFDDYNQNYSQPSFDETLFDS